MKSIRFESPDNKIKIESDKYGFITSVNKLDGLTDCEFSELLKLYNHQIPIGNTTRKVIVEKLKKLILKDIKPTHLIEYKKIYDPARYCPVVISPLETNLELGFRYAHRYVDPYQENKSPKTRLENCYQRLHVSQFSFQDENQQQFDFNNNFIPKDKEDTHNQETQITESSFSFMKIVDILVNILIVVVMIIVICYVLFPGIIKPISNISFFSRILKNFVVDIEKNSNEKILFESTHKLDLLVEQVEYNRDKIVELEQKQNDLEKISNLKHRFVFEKLEEQNILIKDTILSTVELFEEQRINTETFVTNSILESEKQCSSGNQAKEIEADYASEANGGRFLFTTCTTPIDLNAQWLSFYGYSTPLKLTSSTPRVLIQGPTEPGNCYAFKGEKARIFFRLAKEISPTSFTIEHISKELSITKSIDHAPKEFIIYGYENEDRANTDDYRLILGDFKFDYSLEPTQTFEVKHKYPETPISIIELQIISNSGNKDFTCIYKFRVHGELFVRF